MNDEAQWRPALLGRRDGEKMVCELCPHRCQLADGETGLCRVRRRTGESLETATLASTVFHEDAVERKPLYHFRPGAKTLTLAAPGCTFLCSYCINFRVSQFGRPAGIEWSAEPVDIANVAAHAKRLDSLVALSYTEPGLAPELTLGLAGQGLDVVWKTNGFLTREGVDLVAPALSAANVDVKAAREDAHRSLTGGSLAPVWDFIARLKERGVWVEVSTPLIPGVCDGPEDLRAIARRLSRIGPDIPWHLARFTPTFRMTKHVPTAPQDLRHAVEIGHSEGLRYVYVERALGEAGRATACPVCARVLVHRDIWSCREVEIVDGRCPSCAAPIAGRW